MAAITDPDLTIRRKALDFVLKCRRENQTDSIRHFYPPGLHNQLNLGAASYLQLVDLKKVQISEPPLLFAFDDDELKTGVEKGTLRDLIPAIPNHSQNNERCVADTTAAARKYNTRDRRHANILATNQSRETFSTDCRKGNYL